MSTNSSPMFQFDVALSFAGEDRDYVGDIAEGLRSHGIRVFYDEYEQVALWGRDLYEHLDYVYQQAARYCVLFVSEHYARKVWTNHERKSAQARALHENREYILPVRFDDTEIPGLRSTVAYVDARSTTQDQLVGLILAKLNRSPDLARSTSALFRVPRTTEQQRALLTQRPPFWEYLLFAGVLAQGKAALEPKWEDHQLQYVRLAGPALDDSRVLDFVKGALSEAQAVVSNLERILAPRVQERAFGPPGVEGDPVQIEQMGQRVIGIYEGLLDWATRVRGTATSEPFRPLFELLALLAEEPIKQSRDFIDQYVAKVEGLPERLAATNERPIVISLNFVLSLDSRIEREFNREFKRIKRRGLFR